MRSGTGHGRRAYSVPVTHTATPRPGTATGTWARSALEVLARLPAVHRVGLAFVEAGGRQLSFTASDRQPGKGVDWCHVDAYEDVPLNVTVTSGRLIFGSLEEHARRYRDFVARQTDSTDALASVPLVAAGQTLGGFALFYDAPQRFDGEQLGELAGLGERLGEELRRVQRSTTLPSRSLESESVSVGARVATLRVAPEPEGVPLARHFARDTMREWGLDEDTQDTAVLCVSELVTNAIIHTVVGCEIQLVVQQGVLTISVRDGGTAGGHAHPSQEEPLAVHGRGLHLVHALSTRWGSQLDTVGMTVWCELAATP
jgi:anti-sigma regulatory factor (Ser/Thr protein kinase)